MKKRSEQRAGLSRAGWLPLGRDHQRPAPAAAQVRTKGDLASCKLLLPAWVSSNSILSGRAMESSGRSLHHDPTIACGFAGRVRLLVTSRSDAGLGEPPAARTFVQPSRNALSSDGGLICRTRPCRRQTSGALNRACCGIPGRQLTLTGSFSAFTAPRMTGTTQVLVCRSAASPPAPGAETLVGVVVTRSSLGDRIAGRSDCDA